MDDDVGVRNAVEGGGLHHGVVRHVREDEALTDLEGLGKGELVDDIAREAGGTAKSIGVRELARHSAAENEGAVRHLQSVGHVRGGGNIEECGGHIAGGDDVHDSGDEVARVEGDGFTGLQIHLFSPTLTEGLDEVDQSLDVVVVAGDVVSSAHVDPGDLFEKAGETLLNGGDHAFEDIGVLLAEGVEVEALQSSEVFPFEGVGAGSESAPGRAGVVERDLDLGVLGIDAQAGAGHVETSGTCFVEHGAEGAPLTERVEADVIGDGEDLTHFLGLECGRVDVDLAVELLAGKHGFMETAGAAATEVLADEWEGGKHGEALQREQDGASGGFLYSGDLFQVRSEEAEVDDEGGRVDSMDVEQGGDLVVNVGWDVERHGGHAFLSTLSEAVTNAEVGNPHEIVSVHLR